MERTTKGLMMEGRISGAVGAEADSSEAQASSSEVYASSLEIQGGSSRVQVGSSRVQVVFSKSIGLDLQAPSTSCRWV
jgi:hypothetical protein